MSATTSRPPSELVARPGSLGGGDIAGEIRERMRDAPMHAGAVQVPAGSSPVGPSPALDFAGLLALRGAAFVEAAFATLLRRRPEPAALEHFTAQLASAERSKAEILVDLRYGPEGRAIGAELPGLRRRYLLQRACRLRMVGRLVRILVGMAQTPRTMRDLTRLEQELHAGRQKQDDLVALTAALRGVVADTAQRAARLQAEAAAAAAASGARLDAAEARLRGFELEPWAEPLVALAERTDEQARRFLPLEAGAGDAAAVAAVLRALRAGHGWPEEEADAFAARIAARLGDVTRRAAQADATAERNRVELLDQSRRLGLLLADVRKRLDQPFAPEEASRLEAEDDHRLDPLYLAFEDRFRGSRADIRERQRVYLPLLREAREAGADGLVVDVGAGRGEWLELLRAEGVPALGVDLNRSMVELCRGLGLDCAQDDAIEYLRRLPDNHLGAVTGFHIIEHLPFKTFVALLDESLRVLKPGGLVLFETPNPANVLVGSRWFYLDPTHRNPMPGEMTAMIAEARGFVRVSVRELHPSQARFSGRDEELARQLDAMFHGPQDYALLARKA